MTDVKLQMESMFITLMNVTLGMVLALRTNTAYDRFWEGRRLWGQIYAAIRNLSRFIWLHTKELSSQDVLEKRAGIGLLLGFAVAVKHYLREEYDFKYVKPYIGHIPRKDEPGMTYKDQSEAQAQVPLLVPLLDSSSQVALEMGVARFPGFVNYPLEICNHIAAYLFHIKTKDILDSSIYGTAQSALLSLVDALSGLERIRRTPMPVAYSLHLSHILFLYLIMMPFQLIKPFGWEAIPVCFVTAFCFMGLEALGREIENPFGYDENDLTVELFCEEIADELKNLTTNPPPKVSDWNIKDIDLSI
jgi:putative membrane protein